ncbi:ABC transporter substrate-binding protein [Actinacidiphila paucisporea]|uniref:Carbohydrate ABC transporter substrate-binding protein, CUT1 family n=1 Tax=Actinacidiphila paucisporea TaxID=310782 RepID=A0A1M7I256_9ACTN|nr:extracellular solute-binding protein [Actinacidiphila paucisporea]SHM34834.1 carbohydrate ABC transporter substrate-binding protein, CUT1 family [Actinacidiphila paucisporea]
MNHISRRSMLAIGAATLGTAALGLTACSSDSGGGDKGTDLSKNRADAMDKFAVGDQFKAAEPIAFTTLLNDNPGYPEKGSWLFWSELAKRTNVTLKPTVVPLSDYENKRSVIIGAGSAPFLIPKTYPGQEAPFVASGSILPISDYVDLMPNFKDKVARWNLQGDVDTLRQDDGKYYVLPGLHQDVWIDYSFAIRTDVLDELGLQIPKTLDDLHSVLTAIKAAKGGFPMSDRWNQPTPGGALLQTVGQAFGAGSGGGWGYANATFDTASGKFVFTGSMDQYKQTLSYVASLVKDGLLDPESFTQTDDQANAKFTSGKTYVISTNAQELVNTYRVGLAKSVPSAKVVKIPVPTGPAGDVKVGIRLENGLMISKKARDSKDFVALIQFVDWLYYSDDGQIFAKWGVEGVTYTRDAAGSFHLTNDVDYVGLNPTATKKLNVDFGFSNGNFAYGGSTQLLESTFSQEEKDFQKVMTARKTLPVPPPHPLNADEQEQSALWDAPLKDYVQQQTLKFILGERDFGQWDAYVSELKGKNSDAYIDLVNKAYQRFKDNQGKPAADKS